MSFPKNSIEKTLRWAVGPQFPGAGGGVPLRGKGALPAGAGWPPRSGGRVPRSRGAGIGTALEAGPVLQGADCSAMAGHSKHHFFLLAQKETVF